MRTLYYVPIIMHTPEELGSLAKPFLEIKKQLYGPRAEEIYREKANQYWAKITKRLEEIDLNTPEKTHIYVDGLPQAETHHLQAIVQELIALKLPSYLIAQKLTEKGAVIHGTESIKLLLEEHNMWANVLKGISPDPKRKAELLQERDEFIAKRINATLPKDEVGILFIGAAHKVDNELKKFPDIKIILFEGGD